jgi:hypothetical protein
MDLNPINYYNLIFVILFKILHLYLGIALEFLLPIQLIIDWFYF